MAIQPRQSDDRCDRIRHEIPREEESPVRGLPAVDSMLLTAEGYRRLCEELETLRGEGRRSAIARLREARADGHLDDNAGLLDALEEQAQLERRIATLEARLASARVAEPNGDGSAGIGSSVLLRELETGELVTYELVGPGEANLGESRVSVDAPVGRALLGAVAGHTVAVACPGGEVKLQVVEVVAGDRSERKAA
jgi:transcription elongation factor GreA